MLPYYRRSGWSDSNTNENPVVRNVSRSRDLCAAFFRALSWSSARSAPTLGTVHGLVDAPDEATDSVKRTSAKKNGRGAESGVAFDRPPRDRGSRVRFVHVRRRSLRRRPRMAPRRCVFVVSGSRSLHAHPPLYPLPTPARSLFTPAHSRIHQDAI